MIDNYYSIAGHLFRLYFSDTVFDANGLSNYAPFRVECAEYCLFSLSVVDALHVGNDYEPIGSFTDDIATITVSKLGGSYYFQIAQPEGESAAAMLCNATFTEAQVSLGGDSIHRFFGLNNCLMMMYAFATAPLGTLMVHASVVMFGGKGYVFQGKSGTGKSTHSRLWLEHIAGTELLNDDNPILKKEADGSVRVYGSPWSGKTPCYRNESVQLSGIVKLRQAPHNGIRRNSVAQAFAALKPTCSTMPWDERIHNATCDTVARIVEKTASYTLDCLPDREAALICHNTVINANR